MGLKPPPPPQQSAFANMAMWQTNNATASQSRYPAASTSFASAFSGVRPSFGGFDGIGNGQQAYATCACNPAWTQCIQTEQAKLPTTAQPLTPATLQLQDTTRRNCLKTCFARSNLAACVTSNDLTAAWNTMYDCRKQMLADNGCSNQPSTLPFYPPYQSFGSRPDRRVMDCKEECEQDCAERLAHLPVRRCARQLMCRPAKPDCKYTAKQAIMTAVQACVAQSPAALGDLMLRSGGGGDDRDDYEPWW